MTVREAKRWAMDKRSPLGSLPGKAEHLEARMRAKERPPFRVTKCQFGFKNMRDKGLVKNMAQLVALFALSNLWMA